jgi:hypothetical protein
MSYTVAVCGINQLEQDDSEISQRRVPTVLKEERSQKRETKESWYIQNSRRGGKT